MYQNQITPELLKACEEEMAYRDAYDRGPRDGREAPSITRQIEFEKAVVERMASGKSLDDIVSENAEAGLSRYLISRYCLNNQDILKAP